MGSESRGRGARKRLLDVDGQRIYCGGGSSGEGGGSKRLVKVGDQRVRRPIGGGCRGAAGGCRRTGVGGRLRASGGARTVRFTLLTSHCVLCRTTGMTRVYPSDVGDHEYVINRKVNPFTCLVFVNGITVTEIGSYHTVTVNHSGFMFLDNKVVFIGVRV